MTLDMDEINFEELIEEFEALTKNAGSIQEETLKKILEENGGAEYLQNLGLNGRTDPESFKACVRPVTHKDLEPYIKRIADGDDSSILTRKPFTTISLSSGTTQGMPKYIPFNDELMDSTIKIYLINFAFRNREFPISGGKALHFIYSSSQFKTSGGLTAGTATTNVFRHPKYMTILNKIQSQCCSPQEVIFGSDFHQSLYCHLLCSLIYFDEIQLISSTFIYSIVLAFRTFEMVWEELCTDLRTGVLSAIVTDSSVRAAMARILVKGDHDLATMIHEKCVRLKDWYGLIPELFPNAKYVHGIMTGSMEPYLGKLRQYAGGLPLLSADYGASEGWVAANVNPRQPPELATFAVLPNIGFFEFIPLNGENDISSGLEPKPVGITDVTIGEEYEIILTNFAGLYRYKLGDVVRVMGFHNSTPEIQFVCRRNLLPTINIDKNTERDLQRVVEAATLVLAECKLELVDFTSHIDMSNDPGHYIILWELSGEAGAEVLKQCCNRLDGSFLDPGYVSSRKMGTIGALELRVLRRGTFQKIVDHYVGSGNAAASQFKTPRCVGVGNHVVWQILCANVVESYFSTAFG